MGSSYEILHGTHWMIYCEDLWRILPLRMNTIQNETRQPLIAACSLSGADAGFNTAVFVAANMFCISTKKTTAPWDFVPKNQVMPFPGHSQAMSHWSAMILTSHLGTRWNEPLGNSMTLRSSRAQTWTRSNLRQTKPSSCDRCDGGFLKKGDLKKMAHLGGLVIWKDLQNPKWI